MRKNGIRFSITHFVIKGKCTLPEKEKFIDRRRYNCTIITVASSATIM
jgi:hypothetical protein